MPALSSDRNPIEQLAEEFADRYRRGQRPSLAEYVAQYPDLADDIRELFPALVAMEQLKPATGDLTGDYDGAAHIDLPPRQRLGDYRLLRTVGRGGMGVVYEAEQVSLGRHVALKVLPGSSLLNPTFRERFRREAKAAARLHHTNIVPVYGVGEADGYHFYAMQFIAGQGLDDVLQDLRRWQKQPSDLGTGLTDGSMAEGLLTGRFASAATPPPHFFGSQGAPAGRYAPASAGPATELATVDGIAGLGSSALVESSVSLASGCASASYWRSVARLGEQVADALSHAHRQGILHRDIKPSNLLLDAQGTVWVTDFGLAKETSAGETAGNLTVAGDIVGTIRYMAPERFDGGSLPQSDIYSLGLTLYELLTLRPAFDERSRPKLIERVLHEPPAPPRQIDPRIPRDLETIVLKCLAKEPSERYATAEALAEDLRRFLADRPILARRSTVVERLWRLCRRNPATAALTASVALLLIVISVGASVAAWRLDGERQQAIANLDRAERAEETLRQQRDAALENLRASYLAQAQAGRWSGRTGRRFDSLQALRQAALIRPAPDLRHEAVACMSLVDLRFDPQAQWHDPYWRRFPAIDAQLTRYALTDGYHHDSQGHISIRRVADQQEVMRLPGFGMPAVLVKFSLDGRHLAVKYHDDRAVRCQVWDLKSGQTIITLPGGVCHGAFDFSPDSRWFAAVQLNGILRRFELPSGAEAKSHAIGITPYSLHFHPDGRKLAGGADRLKPGTTSAPVHVWDPETGKVLTTYPHPRPVRGLGWRDDGKQLVTACANRIAYLWDAAHQRQPLQVLRGHQAEVNTAFFNRQGNLIATTSWDNTTRLWDAMTGRQLLSTDRGNALGFSPDDRKLAFHIEIGTLALADVAAADECRHLHGHKLFVFRTEVHPQGRLMASVARSEGIRFWDLATATEIGHCPGNYHAAIFHPDGLSMWTAGNRGLHHWPIQRDDVTGAFQIGPPQRIDPRRLDHHQGANLSPDGQTMAMIAGDGKAFVFDVAQPDQKLLLQSKDLSGVAFSPQRTWIVTSAWPSPQTKIWEAATGRLLHELPIKDRAGAQFSPDGKWLVTGTRHEFIFWEVGAWQPRRTVARHNAPLSNAVFSADGKMAALELATGKVHLVEPETGREFAVLPAGMPMGFSPDGSQMVAQAEESRLQVWDLRLIRQQLGQMKLDWDMPPYPAAPAVVEPIRIHLDHGALARAALSAAGER